MKKAKSKAYYRNRCDRLIQEIMLLTHDKCLVCGKPNQVAHHYFAKARCGNLRFNFKNLINLCKGCHLKLHTGDPSIQNEINRIKGDEWLKDLTKARNKFVKIDITYYRNMVKTLELLTPYKTK